MAIDPRIALAGVSPTYDFMGAYNTSRAAAQTAQANQMAMQRRVDAQAAMQNYLRPPPVQPAPAMQPGSSGPPIVGAPLPPVNTMGAGMGAPPPAGAPAVPVNAALNMRDITPLLQFAGEDGIDALIAENVRGRAAAAAAVTSARQADEEERAATNFTEGYIAQAASRIASVNGDPATLARELAWLRSIPGVNPAIVDGLEARVADMPPEELAGYARNYSFQYANSRAASQDLDPNMVAESTGADRYYRQMNPRGEGYGETSFSTPQVLSPAAEAADRRSKEENAREDTRVLQRRWDAYDDAVATHNRWVESAEGPQQRAQRAQAPVPRPPAEPRPGSSAPAPAAPRGGGGAVVDVTTRAQAEALEPGTRYRTPDGRVYTR